MMEVQWNRSGEDWLLQVIDGLLTYEWMDRGGKGIVYDAWGHTGMPEAPPRTWGELEAMDDDGQWRPLPDKEDES